MNPIIKWFVNNPVAANLLMLMLVVSGLLTLPNIHREEFPNLVTDIINVDVVYPGATPIEIEHAICVKIEEKLEGLEGIKSIDSVAAQSRCTVSVTMFHSFDKTKMLGRIKSEVDAIDTFPVDSEKPIVTEFTVVTKVLQIMLSGYATDHSLKVLGTRLSDGIRNLPGVSQVSLEFVRDYEIAIEVKEQTLREYGLTLSDIASAIEKGSIDLPAGSIKTRGGEVVIRAATQAYTAVEFENITVLTRQDGSQLKLGDIAAINDGFADSELTARFDGKPAVLIDVRRIGDEDVLDVAERVKAYVAQQKTQLPNGLHLDIWQDESQDLVDRLKVMSDNGLSGLLLVLVALSLFLHFRLAFWVAVGIPIAMLGAVALFPTFGISISSLSVMAFILVLGILVDDAIVVGERIYAHHEKGLDWKNAAIQGTQEVSIPVIFGVLTTMVAFIPVITIEGNMNQFFGALGMVAIIALFFSIIESQLILPSHLAARKSDQKDKNTIYKKWDLLQSKISGSLDYFSRYYYKPALKFALQWRLLSVAVALSIVIIMIGLIASGRMVFQFFPGVEGNRIYATLTMPSGTSVDQTMVAVKRIEDAGKQLTKELQESENNDNFVKHRLVTIGAQLGKGSLGSVVKGGSHQAEIVMELDMGFNYDGTPSTQIASRWRELVGEIPDALSLSFTASAFDAGKAIDIKLLSDDFEHLKEATHILRTALEEFPGVYDISDSFRVGKQEVQIELLPEAHALGLSNEDLVKQVRAAFYGVEAQRVQRGDDDIKVMVRYPASERSSLYDLESMHIATPEGRFIPFSSVAKVTQERNFAAIARDNGQRVIHVMSELDRHIAKPEEVLAILNETALKEIKTRFPEMDAQLSGEAEEAADARSSLKRNIILSLILIYALLAIPLKSYSQPMVIMSVIPFAAIGAMIGHLIIGIDLVFFSLLGIVALSGVVINSSLVLVDYINRLQSEGMDVIPSIMKAGQVRFRPIILTSLTTFIGLIPLINADSLSVNLFVPMAVSLSFGVIIATSVSLLLVPCIYLLSLDIKRVIKRQ